MNAGRHALGWLVAGNAVGLWLSLLLLFPGLQDGAWTYGRWMPVHLNVQLYGWTALPLAGWLLSIYGVSRRWSEAAVWAWSAALFAGVLSWLGGGSSGKIFLDWKGGALAAFVAALAFLWVLLACGWWSGRREWTRLKRLLCAAGLLLLAAVPWGMVVASSPAVYPPIDRGTGGPTGASLLGSTLVVVALLMMLPRACGLVRKTGRGGRGMVIFLVASWVVCGIAEGIGGSHADALQIGALALLLPWPWLVWRDWRGFVWPDRPHGWRVASMLWWGLLVVTGFIAFLPGVLDRLKFSHGLVAHSHLAMAGFTTSFCALLLRLTGHRFGSLATAVAWNVAALAMVAVLAFVGWAEGAGASWMVEPPAWRTVALVLRALCGLVMLAASVHWWATWRADLPERAEDSNHEKDRPDLEPGSRRDGLGDGPAAGVRAGAGAGAVRDRGPAGGVAGLPELDRGLRDLGRPFLRPGAARRGRRRDRVDLHGAGPLRGGRLSDATDPGGDAADGVGDGGAGGRDGGGLADYRPQAWLLDGPGRLIAPLRAAGVVAMVYAHFLIFAQFSWVELMRAAGGTAFGEQVALGVMAVCGIAAGFLAAWRASGPGLLRVAFLAAGLAAALAPRAAAMPWALGISVVSGAAIGALTVTLATLLPRWCGIGWVGLGTGLGYALCNVPSVFQATPSGQAALGAGFALAGALLVPRAFRVTPPVRARDTRHDAVAVVLAFTALVWLDSAAFFIIQHEGALRSATWGGPLLWRNAAVHLGVALVAGLWLRRAFRSVLLAAWVILALAALAVNAEATRGLAGWWYPVGVSLYSTALVAWPGYHAPVDDSRRIAWRAAWLFAVAGWFGSANGIGMVQSLQRVPAAFVFAAGAVVAGALVFGRARWPVAAALVGIAVIAGLPQGEVARPTTAVERGRAVYLAEGCIHCHSRYVRPGSADELPWGSASDPALVLAEQPVLIGNRRQGPDLARVGARRSAAWMKAHFIAPRELAPDSPMPSYADLFKDGRGDDLIAFLREVPADAVAARAAAALAWRPAATAIAAANGRALFDRHCAVCHGDVGHGDGPLASSFAKAPADLDHGPFMWTPSGPELETRIARAIKFGIPGTDMPGHETLDDGQLLGLARYVAALRGER